MAVCLRIPRFAEKCKYLNRYNVFHTRNPASAYCTIVRERKSLGLLKSCLFSASLGALFGGGYGLYKKREMRKNAELEGKEIMYETLETKPHFKPSREVVYTENPTTLNLTLFQYQTCPFCCKVRVFLDYYGLSYNVVEVDPVLRSEIQWSGYKKVPILLTKVDGGYQPLNDSSMIVSLLASYLRDKTKKIENLTTYYPAIFMSDNNGRMQHEIANKYFLMRDTQSKEMPTEKQMLGIVEERKWRKWADDVLVHMLSPNVYRTLGESFNTFNWFSKVGNWEEYFPWWERMIVINVGAIAMWIIAKRLKKRHHLKEDVRQSLYDEVNVWLHEIRNRGTTFMGGENPDLSDLAVYGVLKSIEGCEAFKDLTNSTNISSWYDAMTQKVETHAGSHVV